MQIVSQSGPRGLGRPRAPPNRTDDSGMKYARLLDLNSLWSKTESEDSAVADNAKVRRRGDGDSRIVVRRILDGVRIVTLCAVLKHSRHGVRVLGE
jgi:hypothetical protein